MKKAFVAADFGGGSGRVIAGTIDNDGALALHEVHRFDNHLVTLNGHTFWDVPSLYREMLAGLRKTVNMGLHIASIGIDTWGVDFGLIDDRGFLVGNPICYRDKAFEGAAERYFERYPDEQALYGEAGIQIMDIDTLFRLVDLRDMTPALFNAADRLLFMPDLFSYFLTGEANNEYTIASTSCLIDARTRSWNEALISRVGLPRRLFGPIVMPGTVRGHLLPQVLKAIGADYDIPVVAVGSHDTASAVSAVSGSFDSDGTAYLSSGTWSLLGVALDDPILTDDARRQGFTNEGGTAGKIRFLQNITGLWILQRLMAQWKAEGLPVSYGHLLSEAENSACESMIDVDDAIFVGPDDMAAAIAGYCTARGMAAPATQGDFVRCTLRSLAMRYKKGIDSLNAILGKPVRRLRIIGGGSQNAMLNRLTSEATGLPVEAGPVEATAIGNILVQARALGCTVKSF